MKLFVYGTLRCGEPAHHLLGDARLLAELRSEPRYRLVMYAGYPALVDGGDTAIAGEVYEIEDALIPELDRYEDAPRLYARELRSFGAHTAFVYLLRAELADGAPAIASGDWKQR